MSTGLMRRHFRRIHAACPQISIVHEDRLVDRFVECSNLQSFDLTVEALQPFLSTLL